MDGGRFLQAVMNRDERLDGAFVYAVRSTKVYCRPSCPSRRPRAEQVVFFPGATEAERAGFRPCRRCRPREDRRRDSGLDLVRRACSAIQAREGSVATLAALGAECGAAPEVLNRAFLRLLGISPRQYADALRLACFKSRARNGAGIAGALYEAGYGSSSRLYERAGEQLGMTPATYGRGGAGASIAYTTVASPLGRLLVGATQRGICAVALADSEAALEAALRAEFPKAEIRRDDGELSLWTAAVVEHLEGRQPSLDLPLDVRATAFQRRVWEELRKIPYGRTSTYSEIARRVGAPRAVRAVARACATNPAAIVIPCHRAIREDGSLAGYRWGIDRKRALIATEAACSQES